MGKQIACCVHSPAVLIVLKIQNTDHGELLSVFLSVGEGYTGKRKKPLTIVWVYIDIINI